MQHDLLHRQREQHVEEEDFVAPNDALFLRLLVEPSRPFVLYQLVFEAVSRRHDRQEFLEIWTEEVLQDPKLDRRLGVLEDGHHHDAHEAFVHMTRGHGEDVDGFVFFLFRFGLLALLGSLGRTERVAQRVPKAGYSIRARA